MSLHTAQEDHPSPISFIRDHLGSVRRHARWDGEEISQLCSDLPSLAGTSFLGGAVFSPRGLCKKRRCPDQCSHASVAWLVLGFGLGCLNSWKYRAMPHVRHCSRCMVLGTLQENRLHPHRPAGWSFPNSPVGGMSDRHSDWGWSCTFTHPPPARMPPVYLPQN